MDVGAELLWEAFASVFKASAELFSKAQLGCPDVKYPSIKNSYWATNCLVINAQEIFYMKMELLSLMLQLREKRVNPCRKEVNWPFIAIAHKWCLRKWVGRAVTTGQRYFLPTPQLIASNQHVHLSVIPGGWQWWRLCIGPLLWYNPCEDLSCIWLNLISLACYLRK